MLHKSDIGRRAIPPINISKIVHDMHEHFFKDLQVLSLLPSTCSNIFRIVL
jgi:hypothetical protein